MVEHDGEVWADVTVADVADRPGVYVRLPARSRGQRIEGSVIRGRRIDASVNGTSTGGGVQLALRTLFGRTEVTLRADDPLEALLPRAEVERQAQLRPAPERVDGPLAAQLQRLGQQLVHVDALIERLDQLTLLGDGPASHGFQTPAMLQVTDVLKLIRAGGDDPLATLP
jgi:hypothetical protein